MKNYYNYKGRRFRIKKDSFEKIKELGTDAGKYLTLYAQDDINDNYRLTDDRDDFNRSKTWKYNPKPNPKIFGEVDLYEALA